MAIRCWSRKLYPLVMEIMEEQPETRSSDKQLILSVYKKVGVDIWSPFTEVLTNKDIPPMESITRCRRRVQEHHPNLLGAESVEEQRCLNEQEYKKWSTTF